MTLPASVFLSLLTPLLSVANTEWSKKAEFKTLRHLSYERLSRELHWNAECLWRLSDDPSSNEYINLLRTEAFDSLVAVSMPLDLLLGEPVRVDWLEAEPYSRPQFKHRIEDCVSISDLVDRVHNRLWMLKHRHKNNLGYGDILYLIDLLVFTLAHINMGRYNLRPSRLTFNKQLDRLNLLSLGHK
ncbi:hypothetical protein [Synechococcus elongatus]|uniref:Uncharacterized protein n=1 Tax=Synechococcus elongatus PCC 11801 TaxID=2219813 RepID=A0AAQ3MET6_SYNEL|nr:hypothetical protein [Synechococcus elongatus]